MNIARIISPIITVLALVSSAPAHEPVTRARSAIRIPDPPGSVTLKCDFHIHTVFSDGLVWPSVRVEEAWREGLDAIAITDHIEYQSHKADVSTNHNRSYDIAKPAGTDLEIMVIKGSEITRKMPPGHFNAIFLTNSATLIPTNWFDAVKAARDQGAFIFWNHPGWEAQITNNQVIWHPEHTRLLENGMLHGIEVVNGREYYPEAHRWAIEKKLAMISNSDIHSALNLDYQVAAGDHRPLTLVFAKARTPAALKDALFARRTAVYSGEQLIGDEKFLRSIFEKSIRLNKTKVGVKGKQRAVIQITNDSDVDYRLERAGELKELDLPKKLTLAAGKTVLLEVRGATTTTKGTHKLQLPFVVKNLLIGPDQPMPVTIPLQVDFSLPSPVK
jgi:predicted metal-dependent phosphoesterase TrpH